VVKNGKKRREIYSIIMERLRGQGLPSGVTLPVLQFNDHNEMSEDEQDIEQYQENEDKVEDEDDEEDDDDDFYYDDDDNYEMEFTLEENDEKCNTG